MPRSFCCHLSTVANGSVLLSWIFANEKKLSCKWCHASGNNQWLCLTPGCFTIGCGESIKDHSTTHNEEKPDHCLQLNLSTNRVWCYACRSEVYVESNIPAAPKELHELVLMKIQRNEESGKDSTEESSDDSKEELESPKGLLGLTNLGNTCYMNAALQTLMNCRQLTQYFVNCRSFISLATEKYDKERKTSLAKSYMGLVNQMWVEDNSHSFVAPSGVLHAIKFAHPMFRGFQQHDSQEFLRCFMDQMHEELKQPIIESENESLADEDEESDHSEVEYETCDSGLSDVSVSEESELAGRGRSRKNREGRERQDHLFKRMKRERLNSGSDDADFSDATSDVPSLETDKELRSLSTRSSPVLSRSPSPRDSVIQLMGDMKSVPLPTASNDPAVKKPTRYRSIISDIFDGKVVSSVQCLTCSRVSSTLEAFQDLSLPIPTREQLSLIHSNIPNAVHNYTGWVGWLWSMMFGWLWGPSVSLYDCLAAFFSNDELKGDNMYSCDKCKKLRNGIKMAALMDLPEVLTIHLKRFRHELHFSTKISNKVKFPLTGLDLRPYVCKDCPSRVMTYDLIGVIVHHGTAGGGHYTSYALNDVDKKWYEYDDSTVTPVSDETVENCQAYVLFYRKSCTTTADELSSLQQVLSQSSSRKVTPGLVQFFISRQWMNKLKYFAEPGPIDNTDFLCKHGGVPPKMMSKVSELVSSMSEKTWEHLYSRFGGGPVCTALYECGLCRVASEHLEIRRRREIEEYQKLMKSNPTSNPNEAVMALSMAWFRHWENFVCSRTDIIPGPIDNTPVSTSKNGHTVLRIGSDHLQVSESVWRFFTEIYSGQPEVKVRPTTSQQKNKQRKSGEWQSLGRSSFRNSESQN